MTGTNMPTGELKNSCFTLYRRHQPIAPGTSVRTQPPARYTPLTPSGCPIPTTMVSSGMGQPNGVRGGIPPPLSATSGTISV